jgi:hypothetical protein
VSLGVGAERMAGEHYALVAAGVACAQAPQPWSSATIGQASPRRGGDVGGLMGKQFSHATPACGKGRVRREVASYELESSISSPTERAGEPVILGATLLGTTYSIRYPSRVVPSEG